MSLTALIQILAKNFSKASMLAKLLLILVVATAYGMLVLYKRVEFTQEGLIHCHEQRVSDLHLVLSKIEKIDSKITISDILPKPAMAVVEDIAEKKKSKQHE